MVLTLHPQHIGGMKDKRRNRGSESVNKERERKTVPERREKMWKGEKGEGAKEREDTPFPHLLPCIDITIRDYEFGDSCGKLKIIELIYAVASQTSWMFCFFSHCHVLEVTQLI